MRTTLALLPVLLAAAADASAAGVQWWLSTEDMTQTLSPQPAPTEPPQPGDALITIDGSKRYQAILGLGSSLEHSTCYNISLLPPEEQEKAVASIVDPQGGIGMNLMRICIGTPDFTASPWYTYDDVPEGETDPELVHFSIEKDRAYVLPVLKMALRKNPDLLFFASPWSPPGWMTSNDRIGGGRILPQYFDVYARYFVQFVKAYEAEGLPIYAITPQNEPMYAPNTYPTCRWKAQEQRDFIRDHLGPEFERQGIRTQIWCFDHNFSDTAFPRTILEDPEARKYVAGVAFHHYEGTPDQMGRFRSEFPDVDLFFSEGSTFGVHGATALMDILRNGARSYNAWVTIIDDKGEPNPGPHECSPTCIVLDSDDNTLAYRFDYYMYGHFMKFVQRGAERIEAQGAVESSPACIALRNPDGRTVLVVANPASTPSNLGIKASNGTFRATLPGRSVATFVW